jgi:hypothetical protein
MDGADAAWALDMDTGRPGAGQGSGEEAEMTKEEAIAIGEAAVARKAAEREAERLARLPKAEVIPFEEALQRALQPGRWVIQPFGVTSYRSDPGPTGLEWEFMQSQRPVSDDPHEAYSRSLYGK